MINDSTTESSAKIVTAEKNSLRLKSVVSLESRRLPLHQCHDTTHNGLNLYRRTGIQTIERVSRQYVSFRQMTIQSCLLRNTCDTSVTCSWCHGLTQRQTSQYECQLKGQWREDHWSTDLARCRYIMGPSLKLTLQRDVLSTVTKIRPNSAFATEKGIEVTRATTDNISSWLNSNRKLSIFVVDLISVVRSPQCLRKISTKIVTWSTTVGWRTVPFSCVCA